MNLLLIYNLIKRGERRLKIITLCSYGSCCLVVKVDEDHVEISEEDKLCVLTSEAEGR